MYTIRRFTMCGRCFVGLGAALLMSIVLAGGHAGALAVGEEGADGCASPTVSPEPTPDHTCEQPTPAPTTPPVEPTPVATTAPTPGPTPVATPESTPEPTPTVVDIVLPPGPTATAGPAGGEPGELPDTGSSVAVPLALAGLTLALAGALLLRDARRNATTDR